MTSSKPPDPAPCPTCHGDVEAGSKHLPFCCRRCRMIDLGRWFNEEYAVPGEDAIDLTSIEFPPGFGSEGGPGRS